MITERLNRLNPILRRVIIVFIFVVIAIISTALGFLSFQIYLAFQSDGSEPLVEIPNITNMSLKQAEAKLSKATLQMDVDREVYDSNIPQGYVASQQPLPEMYAEPNSTIKVTVSKGTEDIIVPELAGISERQARILLAKNGLSVGNISYSYSTKYPREMVITNSPAAQSHIKRGMTIDLLVSLGKKEVNGYIMPNLKGKDFYNVRSMLEPKGIRVGKADEIYDEYLETGTILDQTPEPGIMIDRKENIQLTISIGGETDGY